uniref:Zgc:113274 n=1 Tax=Paramormyrops kingsleyae TaxID=1676925 RepID=A0A3B3RYM2_9TELE
MERAAVDVKCGKSIRSVVKDKNIDRSPLSRYRKKMEAKKVTAVGYSGTAEAKKVFTGEVEKELADYIKKLADQFHGLTPKKCCELEMELKGLVGRVIPLHITGAEVARVVKELRGGRAPVFFDNLAKVMDR